MRYQEAEEVKKLLLSYFLKIPKEKIEEIVEKGINIVDLVKQHAKNFAKYLIRMYWREIEDILTDVNKVYNLIVSYRPDLKDIFDTPKGRKWLNENVQRLYDWLYKFAWE